MMKKLITLGIIAMGIAFTAPAQHLLKRNYTFKEVAEAVKDTVAKVEDSATKVALLDAGKPLFTADTYSSITSNLGGGFTILPTVKLLGTLYNKNKKGNGVLNFKAYFSADNFDTIVKVKANQLYFPDASKFGLNLNYSLPFGKKDDEEMLPFCFNTEAYYLSKSISSSGIKGQDTSETVNLAQLKMGLEWAISRNNLSLFWNFNYGVALTQRDYFKQVFTYKKNNYVFNEVGLQGRYKILEKKEGDKTEEGSGVDMYLTFGAIIHSGDTRTLSGKTSDAIVPFVRFGLNAQLFNKK